MPIVPTYEQKVSEAPLPDARVPTQQPLEAFGGGEVVSGPERGFKHLTSDVMEIGERSYKAAQFAQDVQNQNNLDDIQQKALYGFTDANGKHQAGAIERINGAGPNAFAIADELKNQYDQSIGSLSERISDPHMKDRFQKRAQMTWREMDRTIQAHAGAENERFQKTVIEDSVQKAQNLGTSNYAFPDRVEEYQKQIRDNLSTYLSLKGYGREQIDAEIAKPQSELYQNVLEQYLSNNQDLKAKEYYSQIKDKITDAKIQTQVAKMMQAGTEQGDAQRVAFKIADDNEDSYTALRALEEGSYSDKEKQLARPILDTLMVKKKQQTDEFRANNIISAANTCAQTGDWNKIDPKVVPYLTPKVMNACKAIANNTNGTDPIKTDKETFNHYMSLSPIQLVKLPQDEIMTDVRPGMSDSDFQAFTEKYQTAIAGHGGNQQAMAKANELHSHSTLVLDQMKAAGVADIGSKDTFNDINGNKEKREAFYDISRAAQDKIDTQSALTGKSVPDSEKSKIIKDVISQHVFTSGTNWLGNPKETDKTFGELTSEERKNYRLRLSDVPAKNLDKIYQIGLRGAFPPSMPYDTAITKYKTRFEAAAGAQARGASDATIRSILRGD